jgi:hypothetical protein
MACAQIRRLVRWRPRRRDRRTGRCPHGLVDGHALSPLRRRPRHDEDARRRRGLRLGEPLGPGSPAASPNPVRVLGSTAAAPELLDERLDATHGVRDELPQFALLDGLLEPAPEALPILMAAHAPIVSPRPRRIPSPSAESARRVCANQPQLGRAPRERPPGRPSRRGPDEARRQAPRVPWTTLVGPTPASTWLLHA